MVLDIILIAFLGLSVFLGFRKGLISKIIGIAGFGIAILMALMLQSSVVKFMNNTLPVGKQINDTVYENVNNIVKENKTDNDFYNEILKVIQGTTEQEKEAKIRELSNSITDFILRGISFIGVFILTYIIVLILGVMLNGIFSLPILNSVNKLGGMGIGFVLGLLQIWIILAIISFLSPMDFMLKTNELISSSTLVNLMYNNNFVTAIVSKSVGL